MKWHLFPENGQIVPWFQKESILIECDSLTHKFPERFWNESHHLFVSLHNKSQSRKLTTSVANQLFSQNGGENLLQSQCLKPGECSSCKKSILIVCLCNAQVRHTSSASTNETPIRLTNSEI